MNDTIAAISTALGIGSISIIRVSGSDSIKIVNSVFKGKNLDVVTSHTIHYGFIVEKNEVVDEVLVSIMKKPKTFTTEDVVEINCHGGIATTKKILELLLKNGCRLAEPGEFTKRAFLNGRIDLIKANAVMDLINSKTEMARKMAINNLTGLTTDKIERIRKRLLDIISNIVVNIDYPEYEDIETMTINKVETELPEIRKELEEIIKESKSGKIIKNGINTAIIGKPNVGKSSLLNLLLEEEKAIVTSIKGTTRDVVEGEFILDGVVFRLIDTAGIRKTSNIVEKKGVAKSLELISKADLIIFMLDASTQLTKEEKELLLKIKVKPHIIVINKTDLAKGQTKELENVIEISVKNELNIEALKNKMKELFNLEELETKDLNYLTNVEALIKVEEAIAKISKIEKSIGKTLIDMLEIDLKEIYNLLGEIIGKQYNEDLIDNIFKNFCLGK